MAISEIQYNRSCVSFTSISTVDEIFKNHSITVTWKNDVKYASDLMSLRVLRAILDPGELADYSKKTVQNKFKTVYSWDRDPSLNTSVATSFTDKFEWNNNKDSNMHNLNVTNDPEWTELKFNQAIRRICAGEQGVIYKIYGYSRRMNQGATPMGFFCDGRRVVALSQKNQIINDRWWAEGYPVWKSDQLGPNEGYFVRVAVDMTRDLGENPKKCRRVWASTSKGKVYCFDYWTGTKIGAYDTGSGKPLFALAFDATNKQCVLYNGSNKIVAIKENNNGQVVEACASAKIGELENTSADRIMGAVCTCNRTSGRGVTNFHIICNRETVIRFEVTGNSISKIATVPRTHFGCTTTLKESEDKVHLKETPENQNNVYGIGAGVNGQVWTNGHTPVSVAYLEIKTEGNPIKIFVRAGKQCRHFNKLGKDDRNISLITDYQYEHFVKDDAIGGELNIHTISHDGNGGVSGHLSARPTAVTEELKTMAGKHWGWHVAGDWGDSDLYANAVHFTWDYSARQDGQRRTVKQGIRDHYHPGCKMVWSTLERAVEHIHWILTSQPFRDHRIYTKGKKITVDSLKDLGIHTLLSPGADNTKEIINDIHIEIVKVEDYHEKMKHESNSFLQDLNYFYGCTPSENFYDSNGQLEDIELEDGHVTSSSMNGGYRAAIASTSATSAANGYEYFTPTTRWDWSDPRKMFGFAGHPYIVEIDSNNVPTIKVDVSGDWDEHVTKPTPFSIPNFSNAKQQFFLPNAYTTYTKTGATATYVVCNPGSYNESLPMSIGSVYPRLPADGRMYISRNNLDFYGANSSETKEIKYELMFADRRESKVGYLAYHRPSADAGGKPSSPKSHRLTYASAAAVGSDDKSNACYINKYDADNSPYHVVIDSDNNPWFVTPHHIGKIQLLPSINDHRYRYVPASGNLGLYPYENNNNCIESSIVYLNKHAKDGAKYGSNINPNGITNGYGGITKQLYDDANDLLNSGNFALMNKQNKAYMYNANEWTALASGNWYGQKIYDSNGKALCKTLYTRDTQLAGGGVDGNLDNEFNSDNFGLNCLIQLNQVELGPDIIHPVPLLPEAKAKIIEAYSKSNNLLCDELDGAAFWDKYTQIFDYDQQASGYDDLSTTHYIYDIINNYRTLVQHRYEYTDSHIVGPKIRTHEFELDDMANIVHPELVYDNYVDGVWKVPNYVGMAPKYGPLSSLTATEPYYVDIYIDYIPSVYNLSTSSVGKVYDTLYVARHRVHVFERWPTNKFCLRGIGGSSETDPKTDFDLVGNLFWGDCDKSIRSIGNISVAMMDTRRSAPVEEEEPQPVKKTVKRTRRKKTTATVKKSGGGKKNER